MATYRVFRERKETESIEIEANSLEEANRMLESGKLDSESWNEVDSSMETENKPDWTMEVE